VIDRISILPGNEEKWFLKQISLSRPIEDAEAGATISLKSFRQNHGI